MNNKTFGCGWEISRISPTSLSEQLAAIFSISFAGHLEWFESPSSVFDEQL